MAIFLSRRRLLFSRWRSWCVFLFSLSVFWYPSAFHPVRNFKFRRWLNGCLETSPLYHSIGESVFLNIMASRLEESISDLEVERVRWILKSVLESIKMSRRLYGPANGLASYLTKASPVLKSSANHDIYFKKLWLMVEGFQSKINMLLIAIRSVGRCDSFLLYGGASWKRVRHW